MDWPSSRYLISYQRPVPFPRKRGMGLILNSNSARTMDNLLFHCQRWEKSNDIVCWHCMLLTLGGIKPKVAGVIKIYPVLTLKTTPPEMAFLSLQVKVRKERQGRGWVTR